MVELELGTDDGDVLIQESALPLTAAEVKKFRISNATLRQCFAEAKRLLADAQPADRVRAVADETLDGHWEVRLVRYSAATDPLLHEPKRKRKAN